MIFKKEAMKKTKIRFNYFKMRILKIKSLKHYTKIFLQMNPMVMS